MIFDATNITSQYNGIFGADDDEDDDGDVIAVCVFVVGIVVVITASINQINAIIQLWCISETVWLAYGLTDNKSRCSPRKTKAEDNAHTRNSIIVIVVVFVQHPLYTHTLAEQLKTESFQKS